MGKLNLLVPLLVFLLSGAASTATAGSNRSWDEQTPVWQVLKELGEPLPAHYLDELDGKAVQRGKEILTQGYTMGPDGKRSRMQSRYFQCIYCHNLGKEDPDLSQSDPEQRLAYAVQNDLPFLPGTTLHGVVNRESWFNDYYQEKYGRIVRKANRNLASAIQACSSNCSKGRKLKKWELQSVLSYLWTLQLTLGDLSLTDAEWKKLQQAGDQSREKVELVDWLKGFYLPAVAATYSAPPDDRTAGFPYRGEIEKGRDLFVRGCLHCHKSDGVAPKAVFDNSEATFIALEENIHKDSRSSIYQAIREGIPRRWFKPYMPNYTLERMSDKQIENLRVFIEFQAGKRSVGSIVGSE